MNPPFQWSFMENQISDTVAMTSQVQDAQDVPSEERADMSVVVEDSSPHEPSSRKHIYVVMPHNPS